jgi:hypothetical protein
MHARVSCEVEFTYDSVQQFVEEKFLNNLNSYLLYFPEENSKQLHQDEIVETLDQAKAWDSE